MKHIIIIALLLVSTITNAQTNYEKGMQKAFELWGTSPIEASNLFERIAKAEPDNWLPNYYAAQVLILDAFSIKDKDKISTQLNKAQDLIDAATSISKDNPEIMVLQALKHTVWVAFDGATYGMKYGVIVAGIYEKAYQLAPENPRVVYCKAEWGIGGAKFFGQDTKPFCKELEKALELFANFKPESEFHPKWGKDRTEMLLEDCKE